MRQTKQRLMDPNDWEKAGGVICPQCGQEVLRFINGVCPECSQADAKRFFRKLEIKERARALQKHLRARNHA